MLDNIQITNKNGDAMMVEPICCLKVKSTNKIYLVYTLNEKVNNDLTKIYVAQTNGESTSEPISQEEWDNLRRTMSKMSKREIVEDVEYLPIKNENFVIGEAKKLGIPTLLKQVFKDEAALHSIADVKSKESPTGGKFIDPSFNQNTTNNVAVDASNSAPNIFNNPMQPVVDSSVNNLPQSEIPAMPQMPPEPIPEQSPQLSEEPAFVPPVVNSNVIESATNSVIQNLPVQPQIMQNPVSENVPTTQAVQVEPQIEQAPVVSDIPIQNQPIVSEVSTSNVQVPSVDVQASNADTVTDDEALQAIDVLLKYIEQEKSR